MDSPAIKNATIESTTALANPPSTQDMCAHVPAIG